MTHGVSLQDRHHTVLRANSGLSALLGKPGDEIIGRKSWSLFYGTDRVPKNCPLYRGMQAHEHVEDRATPPGLDKVVQVYCDALHDETGRFDGYLCTWLDVTAAGRAEEALRQSEEMYRLLAENLTDAVTVWNAQGHALYTNPAAERSLGFSRDELSAINKWDQIHGEDLPAMQEGFERALQGKPSRQFDVRWGMKDGSWRYGDIVIAPYRIPGYGPLVLTVSRDVTRRKQVEEALRRSERELAIRNRIADIFLTVPDEEMYGRVLDTVLEAMQSKHGIFGYMDDTGDLVCPSLTRGVWDQCRVTDKTAVFPRRTWGGIWEKALAEKRTFYSNEPFHVPEGHIPMRRSVAVPIVLRGRSVGLLQVANKETDYDEEDRRLLETIAGYIAPILRARLQRDRQERKRRRAEETLKKHRDQLEDLVKERTSDLTQAIARLLQEAKERERAETTLRESEERFSKVFHSVPWPSPSAACATDGSLRSMIPCSRRWAAAERRSLAGARRSMAYGLTAPIGKRWCRRCRQGPRSAILKSRFGERRAALSGRTCQR